MMETQAPLQAVTELTLSLGLLPRKRRSPIGERRPRQPGLPRGSLSSFADSTDTPEPRVHEPSHGRPADLLNNLKRHKDEDAIKGQAVKNQKKLTMAPARKRSKRFEEESGSSSDAVTDSEAEMRFDSDQSREEQFDDESGSDAEGNSDDEESKEENEEEESDAEEIGRVKDAEMEELEKEIHDLRQQQDLLNNLKRHKDEDAIKGQAVKNQKALWDKTLEFRFLLQKAFSSSNKLPQEPIKSSFCTSDKLVNEAYSDLVSSCKETLDSMLELQEALLEQNQSILQGTGNIKESHKDEEFSSDSKGEADEDWLRMHKMHCRIAPFRNNTVDKWHRKTQVSTGAAAFKGKLQAFNQNISEQVAGYMRDPSRMIKRMQLRRSSVGTFGKIPEDSESTKEEDGSGSGDPELLDDSEFYQQLLKEFFESCDLSSSETAFYALKRLQPKKRKVVDRRASKSRKIRYNVHEKIVNFMAPVPMNLPPMATKLFENLFGMGNRKAPSASQPTAVGM